ncbi:MAG: hypothetical protein WA799_07370 [Nitrosotalea sp.]
MARQESSFEEMSLDSSLEKLLKVEKEPKIVTKLTDILSILSKTDALTIFSVAKNGLESELETPQKIGLTKKQYYTRLKQLVELGLLNKNESKYVHTALGNLIYEKHVVGLLNNMKISKELEMIDLLKQTSKFKPEEISNFVSKLYPEMNLGSTLDVKKNTFELISASDTMVQKIIEVIEFAEKEILLVTRFPNENIINAILKKDGRKISTKIITDIGMVKNYFHSEQDKLEINDKNSSERMNVVANPFYPSKIERRYFKAPFCMLIVDQKHVGLEIVDNYEPEKLKLVMFGTDGIFSSQMRAKFENMWEQSSINLPKIA